MKSSPLYRDAFALCGVLLDELDESQGCEAMVRRLTGGALRLLEQVSLALHGFARDDRLEDADAELCVLRTHLSLAMSLGKLEEGVFLDLMEQADAVGRQIGGWRKKRQHQPGEG